MWHFLCELRSCEERIPYLLSRTVSEALESYYITMANVKSRHIFSDLSTTNMLFFIMQIIFLYFLHEGNNHGDVRKCGM
jgi:hypothetical protein